MLIIKRPVNKFHVYFVEIFLSMYKGINIKTVIGNIKEIICFITFFKTC